MTQLWKELSVIYSYVNQHNANHPSWLVCSSSRCIIRNPLYLHGLVDVPAWISNYMYYYIWKKKSHPFRTIQIIMITMIIVIITTTINNNNNKNNMTIWCCTLLNKLLPMHAVINVNPCQWKGLQRAKRYKRWKIYYQGLDKCCLRQRRRPSYLRIICICESCIDTRNEEEVWYEAGPWFNINMSSYQYRKSHCGDKTVVRSSYIHNGISYTGKMSS